MVEKEESLYYKIRNHLIRIETVNLNENWNNIHRRLLELIGL
jgi:hypothetical protein